MGLEDADVLADGGKSALSISCSICLEDVTDYRDRAWAKLQCGHQFHLDCIGSAFNAKGVMQCPNCRKTEKGQWLYADGSRPYAESNIDDFVNHEDFYDITYSESPMWCPFGEYSPIAAASDIDDVELLTSGYNEIVGQHADFSEHLATVPSTTRVCPYIAYVHPSTSSSNVGDVGRYNNNNNNNNRWNSSQSEVPNSYSFPIIDVHYNNNNNSHVDHFSLPTRTNIDMPTSGSYVHPFLSGQSSQVNYPRSWERFEAHFQQPSARIVHRSNTQVHVGSSSDQTHGVYNTSSSRTFNDADNFMSNPYHHFLERDPPHLQPHPHLYPHETGPYYQPRGGPVRQRQVPSHSQYWS